MADSKAEWKKMWDGMSLESLRSHAAWVWYDYTHAGNIRHAPPTRDYAEAVRAEWRRRERNAEQPAEPAGTHGDRRGQRQGRGDADEVGGDPERVGARRRAAPRAPAAAAGDGRDRGRHRLYSFEGGG